MFASRRIYAPIPEQRIVADPHVELAPWLPPGSDLADQDALPRLVLNFEEQGIAEEDLFLVAFADMLFDSPEIFGDPAKSLGLACASCHNRSDVNQRFFITGISPHPGAVDVDARDKTLALADHLWRLRDTILQESWDEAASVWQAYRETATAYDKELR